MAIVGKSADEIKGLLGNASDLQLLLEILQDKKSPLKDRIAELQGIDDLLSQKDEINKTAAKAEKLAAKNEADFLALEAQRGDIAKVLADAKLVQAQNDDRDVALKTAEKDAARIKKDIEKALANSQALELAATDKSAKLDKLLSENEVLKGQLEAQVATYKNRLSALDKVA